MQTYGVDLWIHIHRWRISNQFECISAVCCHKGVIIHHYDVDTVLLYGVLEEEKYVYPRLEVRAEHDQMFKLKSRPVCAKKAAATWYNTIFCVSQNTKNCVDMELTYA